MLKLNYVSFTGLIVWGSAVLVGTPKSRDEVLTCRQTTGVIVIHHGLR